MGHLSKLLREGADALRGMSPEDQAATIREFRRLAVDGQRAAIRGTKVWRDFTIQRDGDAVDEEKRTVWLSIASEAPYERWWGVEVLDVNANAIRDERLRAGAPLLVGHDTADQVGVVESFEITRDRKLRVLARFGRSARAEEIFRDVLDGIRRNSSVGYVIHELVLEKQEEDTNTYRVTDWEPLEGSLVAVPADFTVGVGRAIDTPTGTANERKTEMNPNEGKTTEIDAATRAKIEAEVRAKLEAEAKAKAEAEANSPENVLKREQERVSAIIAAGDEYARHGGQEVARELVKDPKASIESFKAKMLDKIKTGASATAQPGTGTPAGAGARVRYLYGKLQAFKDVPLEEGGTMKAEEAAYRSGMWLAAAVHNKSWAQKWCREHGMPMLYRDAEGKVHDLAGYDIRAQNENVFSAGGALVPVEMEASIIMLRDTYGVMRRVARSRPMNSDTLKIPRRKTGLTAYFFQDDDGTGITESQKAWDNVNLSTKKLGCLSKVSRDLMEDAVISVVDDLAQEMAYAFAVKEDQCYLIGDGTSTYGGITGINTKFEATAYISRTALASGHNTNVSVDNADITSVMGNLAQYADTPEAVFVCSHLFYHTIFNRLKAIAGGNRLDILGQRPDDEYLGYRIITSEAMPKVSTSLANKVMFLFGRFDLASSIGNRRGIEMQTLVERYAELGQIGLIATERFDVNIHDLGTTSASDVNGGRGPISAGFGTT